MSIRRNKITRPVMQSHSNTEHVSALILPCDFVLLSLFCCHCAVFFCFVLQVQCLKICHLYDDFAIPSTMRDGNAKGPQPRTADSVSLSIIIPLQLIQQRTLAEQFNATRTLTPAIVFQRHKCTYTRMN